jgi:predicted HAD superfamily Cof-like phosphohydrolase
MSENPRSIEAEVQQVLDELWNENQIPFALTVGKVTKDVTEYTIHFHDARMRTASIVLDKNHSFRDLVRTAVLARVAKMSGPLKDWHKADTD